MADDIPMLEALRQQAEACAALGSPLYARLCEHLADDFAARGLSYDLLAARPRPRRDAVTLRLLGAAHRLALAGKAARLARQYPSCGGAPDGGLVPAFMDTLAEHRDEVAAALKAQVQTNEVARAAALVLGFTLLARRFELPLRTFEIGAAAGLMSRWDRYFYESPPTAMGDPSSPLHFAGLWLGPADLSGAPRVSSRRACDLAPLDARDADDRRRLLSFVWPDQGERFARLDAALRIAAADDPLHIDTAAAGEWVAEHVAVEGGATTVLFHSIVWQYLAVDEQRGIRAHLHAAGAAATDGAPLAWLRMEPAGAHADVRLTTWPGGTEHVVATAGYHGSAITPVTS